MWFASLKSALYFIVFAIVLQITMVISDFYFHFKDHEVERRVLTFARVEYRFLSTLVLEKDAEFVNSSQQELLKLYQEIIRVNEQENLGLDMGLLKQRVRINAELFDLWEERKALHARLNTILPELAGSVEYIHRHHIAYLKNMNRRGVDRQDYDTAKNFARGDERPVSELDIISAASDIQNCMLEIMEIFSRIQRGFSPKLIHKDFNLAINKFYKATNTFEDYSLDAQDGLLVEELLLNGTTFENSFKNYLDLELFIQRENENLERNRQELVENLETIKQQNERYSAAFRRQVEYTKTASLAISLLMLIVLLTIARKIIKELKKVVSETSRIESDHRYRIPVVKKELSEFVHIFRALNKMGATIAGKFDELAASRNMLEDQVAERTKELSLANDRLKAEIVERERNESERRELEERLSRAEKMEAIGTLAGGVAHDLNNLLSGIVSYPELLLMNLPHDHEFRRPLETIRGAGEQAAVIVEDLLTMARRGVAKQEPVDVNRMVKVFFESHEFNTIKSLNPKIRFDVATDAEIACIMGSRVHLSKTIMNLVSNAAEAISGEGVVTVRTSTEYVDTSLKNYDQVREGEYVKLTVKDNGAGISEENIEKVFEPFFTTKSMGRSGSGLGMAVVWGTVKDHNGYIDVTSEKDKGTTFDLYFPLNRQAVELEVHKEDIDQYRARGESVLVVDDVQEQRDIASFMLKYLGYEVDVVDSGEKAVSYLQEKRVDILLLDMIMVPGMDGLETYRAINAVVPGQKAIIVSGYSESNKVLKAQELGAGAYVKKPYSITELAATLRQELDREGAAGPYS